jgi:hypothetical protein
VALLLAAFVATAGVAFAVGRWSTGTATGGQAAGSLPQLAAAMPADGQRTPPTTAGLAAADAASTGLPTSGATAIGAAAATTEDARTRDAAGATGATTTSASGTDPSGAGPAGMAGVAPGSGGPGGFGRGLEGAITAIEDGEISLTSSDGTTSSVLVDETTTIARQEPMALDDIRVGDVVRVTAARGAAAGPGMAPGDDPAAADGADAQLPASQVIVLDQGDG